MAIFSLDILLTLFGTSLLVHVRSNCCFLTSIQISQEADKVVWYSHLFKNFPQFVVIHTVKGFSIVNEAEVDVFLEFSCFLYDPTDVGNLISGFFAFSKFSLYVWKFSVHVLLPGLKDFQHYFASMWKECNCMVVWTFFGIALLWDWNGNFFSTVATAEFSKFAVIFNSIIPFLLNFFNHEKYWQKIFLYKKKRD